MRHPMQRVARPGVAFVILLVATLVLTAVFQVIGPGSPNVVDFELAGAASRAGEILSSWDRQAQLRAAFGLGIDYLYMPLYSTMIALACVWAASRLNAGALRTLALLAAWGAWLAAGFDAVENIALFRQLLAGPDPTLATLAAMCAWAKFALVVVGIVVAVTAAVAGRRTQAGALG